MGGSRTAPTIDMRPRTAMQIIPTLQRGNDNIDWLQDRRSD